MTTTNPEPLTPEKLARWRELGVRYTNPEHPARLVMSLEEVIGAAIEGASSRAASEECNRLADEIEEKLDDGIRVGKTWIAAFLRSRALGPAAAEEPPRG